VKSFINLLFGLFLVVTFGLSQEVEIGVYRGHVIKKIDFSYHDGSYIIKADTTYLGAILPNEFVTLRLTSDQKIEVFHGVVSKGRFAQVKLIPTQHGSFIRLHPKTPAVKERRYQDGFKIIPSSNGLTIINLVEMDHYLSGVVESEGGGGKHLEYYKAQAVLSRTYALKHLQRHRKEGFSLCDEVHCQAYHNGLRYTPKIEEAVKATHGVYIVDSISKRMVDGFFHANCGGQTSSADYIWKENISYLQPFRDTFCIYTKQATWEKRIPKKEWRDFLVKTYFYPEHDSIYRSNMYTFEQTDRKVFYLSPHLGIPLRDIRFHFNLKSTLFSCYPEGDMVVIVGRGFGHGVGMCQEGAMSMANKGFDYQKIVRHYFDGVEFIDKRVEQFFNQKTTSIWDF
jgi:stage II sporulation protein D